MTAELEAAADGELDLLGRNEVGADIIAEIEEWLRLGFRLMKCGCLANKYGEAAHGPEEEHEVTTPMSGGELEGATTSIAELEQEARQQETRHHEEDSASVTTKVSLGLNQLAPTSAASS